MNQLLININTILRSIYFVNIISKYNILKAGGFNAVADHCTFIFS